MSEAGGPLPEPVAIGAVATPPFARLPDPSTHFRLRAQRFAILAQTHALAPFLHFMAGVGEAQHQTQLGLPAPEAPCAEELERAYAHAMPPLDRARVSCDAALDATFDRFFALAAEIDMPSAARSALASLTRADREARLALAQAALDASPESESLAETTFVAAALQTHFTRLASRLDAGRLVAVGEGACPACGAAPVASLVVGWIGSHGVRFCACSLCSTLWHAVRVKCLCCGSTDGILYEEIENGPGAGEVRAETCGSCRRYVKIMLQHRNPALDPVADDVATLALDLLLRESGFRRGGVNPYLLGY